MKLRIISTIVIALLIYNQAGYAGTYTIPKTYTTGDTLTASDLNNENTAIKAAVDDNTNRIVALENYVGATSYLSIPARGGFVAFDTNNSFAACSPNTFSWSGTGSYVFTAMVNLPQNATITGFTYYFWRSSSATVETPAVLYRQAIPAATRQLIATASSISTDSGHLSRSASTIDTTRAVVDNQNYTYYVEAQLPELATLCVDGARITYTTP